MSSEEVGRLALQDCLNILAEALKIASQRSKGYFLKDASEVPKETFDEVSKSLVPLSILLNKFSICWIGSRKSGPDAVVPSLELNERIDMKLLQTGKLDFEQLKKIMTRMNRADDALSGLSRISLYTHHFRNLCAERKLDRHMKAADLFLHGVLNRAVDAVKWDVERYGNQIDRCNLYFQNVLKSKTFKVAMASLFVSSLAVLITVLNIILPHIAELVSRL